MMLNHFGLNRTSSFTYLFTTMTISIQAANTYPHKRPAALISVSRILLLQSFRIPYLLISGFCLPPTN